MLIRQIKSPIFSFLQSNSGQTALSTAVVFSVVAAVTAIVAVPFLDKTSREYAENKRYGIDTITTSSVPNSGSTKSYIMRRSIFDKGLKKICKSNDDENC